MWSLQWWPRPSKVRPLAIYRTQVHINTHTQASIISQNEVYAHRGILYWARIVSQPWIYIYIYMYEAFLWWIYIQRVEGGGGYGGWYRRTRQLGLSMSLGRDVSCLITTSSAFLYIQIQTATLMCSPPFPCAFWKKADIQRLSLLPSSLCIFSLSLSLSLLLLSWSNRSSPCIYMSLLRATAIYCHYVRRTLYIAAMHLCQ